MAALKREMEESKGAMQALVGQMQEKLAWYAENQELVNKNDGLVAEQRAIIQALEARLAQKEGVCVCKHAYRDFPANGSERLQAVAAAGLSPW